MSPAEERLVADCVEKRQREFRAGRNAARLAMVRLGREPEPVMRGSMGEPVFPHELSGSISHTDSVCFVMLSTVDRWPFVGVDVEDTGRMTRKVASRILTEEEMNRFCHMSDERFLESAGVVFSAKESFCKFIFNASGKFTDFQEVEVCLDTEDGSSFGIYRAHTSHCLARGCFCLFDGLVFTAVCGGW
jgi:4'-phosphopantetheinyl transferase EntD